MSGPQSNKSGASGSSSSRKPGAATGSYKYTHADFSYVRRKRRLPAETETGELNIVPYLDIIVNLIMFLLVTQATLVSLGMVDVTSPTFAAPGAEASVPLDQEKKIHLTIGVASDGFYVAAKGGVLPGADSGGTNEITADGIERSRPTIPKKPDGAYDFPALTARLRSIKTAFPDLNEMFLAAGETIPYEILVRTLDASREDARGPLFPVVAFSQIN